MKFVIHKITLVIKLYNYFIIYNTQRTMSDTYDKETRSFNMSMIKGKNTKPEITVRSFLHRNGLRYIK
jgi:hypothetical protein